MEIVNENHENRFWFSLEQLGCLPGLFNSATDGTPFEGSKLRFTGNRNRRLRLYEFELLATTNVYQDIPGHTLVGFARTEDGGETYHVHRLANIDWTKELVDSFNPLRCDVCGHRRQRKQQFLVRQNDTGKLLVVGGSCSRKFCDVNLEIEIHKFFREAEKIFSLISDGWGQLNRLRDLYFSVALAEEIVRRRGYASQKKADIKRIPSTALYLQWYRMVKRDGELTEEAKEVRALVEPAMELIRQRAKEFEETAFGELISHFENKLSDKWNEFDNNCIAYLKGGNFSDGFAAYFGSIKPTWDNQVGGKKRRESVKGFDGVEVGKCVDLGRFLVVKTAWRENQFGCSLSFICISEDGGKLWFQVTENSKTERLWNKLMGDKAPSLFDIEVELRGTLTDVKQDISFAKRVSIKKIFENGKGVEG